MNLSGAPGTDGLNPAQAAQQPQLQSEDVTNRNSLSKGEAGHSMTLLPENFQPGEYDVICGRGRKIFMHAGNEKFRRMVADALEAYSNTVTKLEKSYILCEIVAQVRQNSPNGGFVKKDPKDGRWYEVGDFLAREKTSQAFRDALHDQYKSSNTAKKIRRQAEQANKFPKRAFSTSVLESKSSQKPSRPGYSDPLIAKLRSRQSARSVFDFDGSKNHINASCPTFRPGLGLSQSAVDIGATRNFEWGNSAGDSELGGGGGGGGGRNFEWGSSGMSTSSGPRQGNMFDSFLNSTSANLGGGNSGVGGESAAAAGGRQSSLPMPGDPTRSTSLRSVDFDFGMSPALGPLSGPDMKSDEVLLSAILDEPLSSQKTQSSGFGMGMMQGVQGQQQQQQQQQGMHVTGQMQMNQNSSDIESKLRSLRTNTFQMTQTVYEEEPLEGDFMAESQEDQDVFDRLANLVGDVPGMGDPFEPSPLP